MAIDSKIRLLRLSYVIYEHPSIDDFRAFAKDFGLIEAGEEDGTIYYRGYGADPYVYAARATEGGGPRKFVGAGFVAESAAEFEKAAKLEGAEVVNMKGRPGGGQA